MTPEAAPAPSLLTRIGRGFSFLALAQLGRRVLALATTAVLARLLTPDDFGVFNMATISVGLLSIVSDLGLPSALVQKAEVTDEELSGAFWLGVVACVGLALVGAAISVPLSIGWREPRVAAIAVLLFVGLPASSLGQVPDALLQRRLQFGRIAIVELIGSLVGAAAGISVALQGGGVWALVAQNLATTFASTAGRLAVGGFRPRGIQFSSLRAMVSSLRSLHRFSAGVLGGAIVSYAARNIDNAVIGAALGARALGYYTLAYNLVLLPGTAIAQIFNRVLFPALASLQRDLDGFRRTYERMLRLLAAFSIPAIAGLCATAPLAVAVIYGPAFLEVAPLVRILVVVGVFEAVNTSGVVLWAVGKPGLLAAYATISVVVMAAAFTVGVRWGAPGVAWSYVVVTPLVFIGPHILAARQVRLSLRSLVSDLAVPLVAATGMGLAVAWLVDRGAVASGRPWLDLAAYVALGVLVYVAAFLSLVHLLDPRRGALRSWFAQEAR